ncbi:hypothetical protein BC834DRAFT_374105 [Gloeopeniophorella convolvens]|nr:hypothetical protein BC834DRAFT_374105 [Gloeopeniophorella convolvens]
MHTCWHYCAGGARARRTRGLAGPARPRLSWTRRIRRASQGGARAGGCFSVRGCRAELGAPRRRLVCASASLADEGRPSPMRDGRAPLSPPRPRARRRACPGVAGAASRDLQLLLAGAWNLSRADRMRASRGNSDGDLDAARARAHATLFLPDGYILTAHTIAGLVPPFRQRHSMGFGIAARRDAGTSYVACGMCSGPVCQLHMAARAPTLGMLKSCSSGSPYGDTVATARGAIPANPIASPGTAVRAHTYAQAAVQRCRHASVRRAAAARPRG